MSERIEGNEGLGPGAPNGTRGPAPSGWVPSPRPRRPIGSLIASVVEGTRALGRKHVELARIEMAEAASVRAKGGGMMAGAGVLGLFAVGFAAASGSAALDLVLPAWAANLIVAVVFAAIAGALVLVGRRAARSVPTTPVRTREMLKEDARWARQQLTR